MIFLSQFAVRLAKPGRMGPVLAGCSSIVLALALSACAVSPADQEAARLKALAPLPVSLQQADAALAVGQNERALGILTQAAKDYPADKQPWLRMAQIRFGMESYGEAITSAQEVLGRDQNNKIAISIIAISGLRVADRAVNVLKLQNILSGNVKAEAEQLTTSLRGNLGIHDIIAPQQIVEPQPVRPRPRPPGRTKGTRNNTQ